MLRLIVVVVEHCGICASGNVVADVSTKVLGGRILHMPDVHGDFDIMEQALQLFGTITDEDRLIFTGDLVDRGPKPRDCYLKSEDLAKKYPG